MKPTSPMRRTLLLSLPVVAMAAFWAAFGRFHPDEPFYLSSGRAVWRGLLPYQDFVFTQMPLSAYLYGIVADLGPTALWYGRAMSVVMTWATAILALQLARRWAGRRAAMAAAVVFCSGSYPLYHLAIVKGYAWGALGIMAATMTALLVKAERSRTLLPGVFIAAAAAARASALFALPALVRHAAYDATRRRWLRPTLLATSCAGLLVLGLIRFTWPEPRATIFGLWTFHQTSFMQNKDVWSDLLEWFWPQTSLALIVLATVLLERGFRGARIVFWGGRICRLLAAQTAVLMLVHVFSGARAAEYHALYFPLACVLLGGWVARAHRLLRRRASRALVTTVLAVVALPGAFFTQPGTWLLGEKYPIPPKSLIEKVRTVLPEDGSLLSICPEVQIAAGRNGVPGTEMGLFSVMYPHPRGSWSLPGSFDEERFLDLIEDRAVEAVVFRQGDLALLSYASERRSGPGSYKTRLQLALRRGYSLAMHTSGLEEGVDKNSYQFWTRLADETGKRPIPEGPNVLLVVFDTTRFDRLGVYGNSRGLTPHLDRWAATGTRMERAYSHAPWTLPSMASLLTSMHPRAHGAGRHDNRLTPLDPETPTLAAAFQTAGYRTATFANVIWLGPRFGLTSGFEHVDFHRGTTNLKMRNAETTTDAALEWIARDSERPFFAMVHYFDPHLVYAPPPPFRARFADPLDRKGSDFLFGTIEQMKALRRGGGQPDTETIKRLEKLYDGEIAYTDEYFGNLLEGLAQMGMDENTVIVMTADHGEEFLEHGGFEHGHSMFDEMIRVPLIISGPDVDAGRVVDDPAAHIDIGPTLCRLAGVPIPPTFTGRDLLEAPGTRDDRPILAQGNMWGPPLHAMIDGRYKVIRRFEHWMIFDLENDPEEKDDIFDSRPDLARRLTKSYAAHLEAAAKGNTNEREALELSEDEIERLQSLGYAR